MPRGTTPRIGISAIILVVRKDSGWRAIVDPINHPPFRRCGMQVDRKGEGCGMCSSSSKSVIMLCLPPPEAGEDEEGRDPREVFR